jgi:hypothetical protein
VSATGGYITLHRRLTAHGLWQERPFGTGQAFVDLILLAAYRDHAGPGGRVVHRGEIHTSQVALADRWGWDRKRVARLLTRLAKEGTIRFSVDSKRDTGGTVVKLVNYDRYQTGDGADGTANGTEAGQQKDSNGTANAPANGTANLIGETAPRAPANGTGRKPRRVSKRPTTEEEKEEKKKGTAAPVALAFQLRGGCGGSAPTESPAAFDEWTVCGNAIRSLCWLAESDVRGIVAALRTGNREHGRQPADLWFQRVVAAVLTARQREASGGGLGDRAGYILHVFNNGWTPSDELLRQARALLDKTAGLDAGAAIPAARRESGAASIGNILPEPGRASA